MIKPNLDKFNLHHINMILDVIALRSLDIDVYPIYKSLENIDRFHSIRDISNLISYMSKINKKSDDLINKTIKFIKNSVSKNIKNNNNKD
jgi:hypothetical protein